VITGASDGIGKEFAVQIARQGFNLVLVSRTQSKLDALAAELKEKHDTDTRVLAMDFTQNRDKDYKSLAKLLDGLDISILINNVGLSHDIPVPFLETPEAEMLDIVTINCIGTLRVTQLVAPTMVRKRKGFILTMSSFGGLFPTPLLATYSGSKAFLQQWSAAFGEEMSRHNVTVQCVESYLVTGSMAKVRRASALIPTPRDFVRAVLGSIGRSRGAQGMAYTSTPYWTHAFMHWFIETFAGRSSSLVASQNRKIHEDIRKRALRKKEREAKKQ
jgi:17beta-estradiol 17-dehydrogenase / very-long-chain 3-oxoacyl-CoA reductase